MRATEAIRIHRLDDKGRGVGDVKQKTTFVIGALPGELVEVDIIEDKRRFSVAQCSEIIESAAERVTPLCPVYEQCGGCQLQHLHIDAQRAYKQTQWLTQLKRIGAVKPKSILSPLIGKAWHYRHRARLSVTYDNNLVRLGFKAAKSHHIVDTDSCVVLSEVLSNLLPSIKVLLSDLLPQQVHEIALHEGDNAIALAIAISLYKNEINLEAIKDRFNALLDQYPQQTIHRKPLQLWLKCAQKPYEAILLTDASLQYTLPYKGLSIDYTPNDFTQINHDMNQHMVRVAMDSLQPQAGEHIADLFCGLGNFSFPIAAAGAKVLSVEGAAAMVKRLQYQAKTLALNGQIKAITQDLFRVTSAQIKSWGTLDTWLLDPPRAGAKALIEAMPKKVSPRKIIYVSCNPSTLARDAALLTDKGYRLTTGRMIDLFPQTSHIESINVFERQ